MFSGIITAQGRVVSAQDRGQAKQLVIAAEGERLRTPPCGSSIAVNGVCLTVGGRLAPGQWWVDISAETLSCSNLSRVVQDSPLNLEAAVRMDEALSGHLVSGHVDAVGCIEAITDQDFGRQVRISIPEKLCRYIAVKGSICVDGVSLTVNTLDRDGFAVHIVPYTLQHSLFATYRPGSAVNIEVDLLARYVERLLAADT